MRRRHLLAFLGALAVPGGCAAGESAPPDTTTTQVSNVSTPPTVDPGSVPTAETTTTVAPPRDPDEPGYPTADPRPTPSYPEAGR